MKFTRHLLDRKVVGAILLVVSAAVLISFWCGAQICLNGGGPANKNGRPSWTGCLVFRYGSLTGRFEACRSEDLHDQSDVIEHWSISTSIDNDHRGYELSPAEYHHRHTHDYGLDLQRWYFSIFLPYSIAIVSVVYFAGRRIFNSGRGFAVKQVSERKTGQVRFSLMAEPRSLP